MRQDDIEEVEEIPEERPKKIPRVLPTSREEYYSRRRYINKEPIEYFPSTFNVDLEEEDEIKESEPESKDNTLTHHIGKTDVQKIELIHILTLIPAFLTAVSFLWHTSFQEIQPFWHSILDFVLLLYNVGWLIFLALKDKDNMSDVMLLLTTGIFSIVMLGGYTDKQSLLLQLLFSIPLVLILMLITVITAYQEGKKGLLLGVSSICIWLLTITGMLTLKVKYFRWMGFVHLIGIAIAVLLVCLENQTWKKRYLFIALLAGIEIVAVVAGFGV